MAVLLRSSVIRSSLGVRAGSPTAFGGTKAFEASGACTSRGLMQTPEWHLFSRAYGHLSFAASGHVNCVPGMAGVLRSGVIRSSLGLRAGSPRAFDGAKAFGACAARVSWALLQAPEPHPFARAYGLTSFAASGHVLGVRTFQTSSSLQSKKNRPLSPHLTVYRPEMSSMSSITNRITAGLVGVGFAGGIFVLKVADTSLSFYPVYSALFFSQQIPHWLILSVGNFALLGVIYHVVHSVRRELQQWGIMKFKV